jgi:hypothetical protein
MQETFNTTLEVFLYFVYLKIIKDRKLLLLNNVFFYKKMFSFIPSG